MALNRLADDGVWDPEALSLEFSDLVQVDPQIELEITGFESGEIEVLLGGGSGIDQEDELPEVKDDTPPVTQSGDQWRLGEHLVYCGDARDPESYTRVLGDESADMAFIDAPYNVKHVHFTVGSGEFSPAEYTSFLKTTLGLAASRSRDGAVHFCCMDWRHLRELTTAGDDVYGELMNLCIWRKNNAGMGALYRSAHELVFVFKVGTKAHIKT